MSKEMREKFEAIAVKGEEERGRFWVIADEESLERFGVDIEEKGFWFGWSDSRGDERGYGTLNEESVLYGVSDLSGDWVNVLGPGNK